MPQPQPPSNSLAHAQEQALRAAASEDSDWTRLAFYYWARGDESALRALHGDIGVPEGDMAALFALAGDTSNMDLPRWNLDAITKPWLLYYVARYLLQTEDISGAISCAKRGTELCSTYSPVFALVLQYARSVGNLDLARTIANRMLEQSPEQDDLRTFLDTPEKVVRESRSDILRRPFEHIGYYVPVYNAENYLEPVLGAILAQAYPLTEFVVVDDGSTDQSAEIAARYPVHILRHNPNRGLAAARNTALQRMEAPYVGSCDSDAVLDPEYLIYTKIELHSSFDQTTGVGGRMSEKYQKDLADSWRSVHMSQDTGPFRRCSGFGGDNPVYMPGCNTLINREAALDVGGYDERHVAVGEDGDMNRRLHHSGRLLVTTPLARCFHLRRDTPLSALRTRWNYEREGHESYNGFAGIGNLSRLFTEHLATAKEMAKHDLSKGYPSRIPMSLLYVCALHVQSLRYGRTIGRLSIGQEHWFQQCMYRHTLQEDSKPIQALRAWRETTLAPLQLPPDTPMESLSPIFADLHRDALQDYDRWANSLTEHIDPDALSATR